MYFFSKIKEDKSKRKKPINEQENKTNLLYSEIVELMKMTARGRSFRQRALNGNKMMVSSTKWDDDQLSAVTRGRPTLTYDSASDNAIGLKQK